MFCFLQGLLPRIPSDNNDEHFKNETLRLLFSGQSVNFGNPVSMFKMNLTNGKFSDNADRKRHIIERYRRKKQKLTMVTQQFAHLSEISSRYGQHPSLSHEVKRFSRTAAKKVRCFYSTYLHTTKFSFQNNNFT